MWFFSPFLTHISMFFWHNMNFIFCLFKDFIYLFWGRREGREKEKERSINVWLRFMHLLLGTCPSTQACALTRNRTSDPLVHRPALNPLNHTSQGWILNSFKNIFYIIYLPFKINFGIKFNYQIEKKYLFIFVHIHVHVYHPLLCFTACHKSF